MKYCHRSLRLKDFDYTQPGPYFVTTVTHGREKFFGEILDGALRPNAFGQIVTETWQWLGRQFPYLELGESILMPDHFHGIICIGDIPIPRSCGSRPVTTEIRTKIKPLGQLVGAFKTVSTKRINLLRNTPGWPVWQRDFYERVIRDESEMAYIHQYIQDNPLDWMEEDEPYLS